MSRPALSGLNFHPADRSHGIGCIAARADQHTTYIVRPTPGFKDQFDLECWHFRNNILLAEGCSKAAAIMKAHKDWFGA